MASRAPASVKRWAMAQAMLRLFASPQTTALRPCRLIMKNLTSLKPDRITEVGSWLLAFGFWLVTSHPILWRCVLASDWCRREPPKVQGQQLNAIRTKFPKRETMRELTQILAISFFLAMAF